MMSTAEAMFAFCITYIFRLKMRFRGTNIRFILYDIVAKVSS